MPDARRIEADSPDAVALIEAMVGSIVAIYADFDRGVGPSATAADFSPPDGGFIGIYEGDRAVAGGGVKRFTDEIGEIKRMYVLPERRGHGLARRLLAELEDMARELGYTDVRLDTGPKQPHARALYLGAGYSEIPDYNRNPYASFWAEKRL